MSQDNLEKEKNSMENNVLEQKEDNNSLSNLNENTNLRPYDSEEWRSKIKNKSKYDQDQIKELSEQIDVRDINKVMGYGSSVLVKSFDFCNSILKKEAGTNADQIVMEDVKQLIEKANKSYDDFNLKLRNPSFLEKMIFKVYTNARNEHTQKIQRSALSNFTILMELKASCDKWKKDLEKAQGIISEKYMADIEDGDLLEKYLIAGAIAQENIETKIEELKKKYEETGSVNDQYEYNELKEGSRVFQTRLENLHRTYCMYTLSIGQLILIRRTNINVQMSIMTQTDNCMSLIASQLTNAVLSAKNREVIDGQQVLINFNNDLVQKVSKTIGKTAEDAEKLIYRSIIDKEAAKNAIITVINSLKEINKIAEEELPKMRSDTKEIEELSKQLEEYVSEIKKKRDLPYEDNIPEFKSDSNTSSSSNLQW